MIIFPWVWTWRHWLREPSLFPNQDCSRDWPRDTQRISGHCQFWTWVLQGQFLSFSTLLDVPPIISRKDHWDIEVQESWEICKPWSLFLYISAFVPMANQVSGAKELQMHQKGYLLLFWRLYSVIFEARLALKHHKSPIRSNSSWNVALWCFYINLSKYQFEQNFAHTSIDRLL